MTLSGLVTRARMLSVPGVGGALGDLPVAEAGFEALSISGYEVAPTFSYRDVGLVTRRR